MTVFQHDSANLSTRTRYFSGSDRPGGGAEQVSPHGWPLPPTRFSPCPLAFVGEDLAGHTRPDGDGVEENRVEQEPDRGEGKHEDRDGQHVAGDQAQVPDAWQVARIEAQGRVHCRCLQEARALGASSPSPA